MHISLETPGYHAVQAYSDNQIQVSSIIYTGSLIVSKQEIISDVEIKQIKEMDDRYMKLLLKYNPEVVIIGHNNAGSLPPLAVVANLSQKGIGMEFMSVGAACRTYNVLLSEERAVALGIIFS